MQSENEKGKIENGRNEKGKESEKIPEVNMEFEDILAEVGSYGIFQKRLLFYFLLPLSIPISWVAYNKVFIMSVPDYWCYVPEIVKANLSDKEKMMLIRPIENRHDLEMPSQCQTYALNYSTELPVLVENSNSTEIFKYHTLFSNISTQVCQNGWDYDRTLYDSTASTHVNVIISLKPFFLLIFQWDLVCDRNHYPHLIFTLASVGAAVATPIYGAMSDRIGRKPTFIICTIVTLVSGVISMVVPSFTWFAVFRLIHGTLYPTLYQAPTIILIEMVAKEIRTRIVGVNCISWTVGMCILPLLAYLCRNWRILGLLTTCCCIPFLASWRFLPESPRWLVSVGRHEEATVILKRIAKTNGYSVPTDLITKLKEVQKTINKEKETTHNLKDLFRYNALRKHFLFVTLSWTSCIIGFYALVLNSTNLYGNEFINFFLLGLVDVPGIFFSLFLMEKLGRRWTKVIFMFIAGFSILISGGFSTEFPIATTALTIIGKFGCIGAFVAMYQQATELYPTPLRALGMGTSATIACVTTICAPYIVYLGTYKRYIPYLVVGGICLVASFTSSFLPETLQSKLPQTIEDGEEIGKQQKYFSCLGLHRSRGGVKRIDKKKVGSTVEEQDLDPLPTV
ncbi:organic cation/carnitine transporter 2-like [Tachypleus tridentatus]|uniref:organic cation/carnitine transporter 2-like n=1 Tax=Tachypleus tridentatus TaxID=6853 RepID=UPI003FCFF5BB